MFYKCSSLKEFNLRNLNIDNIVDITQSFFKCKFFRKLNEDIKYFYNKNNNKLII